jgi:hypothetical protein
MVRLDFPQVADHVQATGSADGLGTAKKSHRLKALAAVRACAELHLDVSARDIPLPAVLWCLERVIEICE